MADSETSKVHKYDEPKILLVDVEEEAIGELVEKGFDVLTASLGEPYRVERENKFYPVEETGEFPRDYKERDIVAVDLHLEIHRDRKDERLDLPPGLKGWWANHKDGYVNPRALFARKVRRDFNRILNNGGAFMIFADAERHHEFRYACRAKSPYSHLEGKKPVTLRNWDLLSVISSITIGNDFGDTVILSENIDGAEGLGLFLDEFMGSMSFDAVLSVNRWMEDEWRPILKNKYEQTVGSVILPNDEKGRAGYVFIFPQIENKSSFIAKFIEEILPSIEPRLFPEFDNESWIHDPEYEFSVVKNIKDKIYEIKINSQNKIKKLESRIDHELDRSSYLYDILTESGDLLVRAVIESLRRLGFSEVVDVDKVVEEEGGEKREDIQIWDSTPTLIGEVKGIGYFPSDEDALTVQKYVTLRMKEWERVDVQGITIINHQRNLPPLERENVMPFRQEILDAAEEQEIGLITTWDLHRLVRSYLRNEWEHHNVRGLFYQFGRIDPVPSHYEYIGTIKRYIDEINVVGIEVESSVLQRGDQVAFELPVFFEEQVCESLEFDNKPIDQAEPGMLVGMETHLSREQAQSGVRVFRVASQGETHPNNKLETEEAVAKRGD